MLTGLAVVENEVAHGILLVANRHTSGTSSEGQISHKASAALLDEQSDVNDAGISRHHELDVLQTRCLGLR